MKRWSIIAAVAAAIVALRTWRTQRVRPIHVKPLSDEAMRDIDYALTKPGTYAGRYHTNRDSIEGR